LPGICESNSEIIVLTRQQNFYENFHSLKSIKSILTFLNTNHGVADINNLKAINKKGLEEFEKGPKIWFQGK
jgi:hypothetical protein